MKTTELKIAAMTLLAGGLTYAQPPVNPSVPQPDPPPSTFTLELVKTPDAELFSREGVERSMRKAADFGLTTFTQPGRNEWVRSTFYAGVMATYYTTSDTRYLDAATSWAQSVNFTTATRDKGRADNQCCGQVYCELYMAKKDPRMLETIRASFDEMARQRPRGRAEWWWCDALFMAPTVMVRLTDVTGDPKYVQQMHEMYWDSWDFLFDRNENLFYRDQNYFYVRTMANCQKIFWSRGNGWVIAGLARILPYLPQDDPHRARYVDLYVKMASRLAGLQRADGLWRSSLLDADEYPFPESSGTGFFTFALAWGINNGLLDREQYLPVVKKGWRGLNSVITSDGMVGYVQQIAGAPGFVRPDQTQEYAVGAFLLAGSEVAKLKM
ncbi:MAG: glycoside hydrolase family 88/105 protein [Candidatus Sumerlaeaceae bacterium]